jgi:hypothetical protein
MSDMPTSVQRIADLRWVLLGSAALLTVVAGFLGWTEVVDGAPATATRFVWGAALVLWVAFVLVCCTYVLLKRDARIAEEQARIAEERKRDTARIISAITERRLTNLADLMEDEGKVRSINGRR